MISLTYDCGLLVVISVTYIGWLLASGRPRQSLCLWPVVIRPPFFISSALLSSRVPFCHLECSERSLLPSKSKGIPPRILVGMTNRSAVSVHHGSLQLHWQTDKVAARQLVLAVFSLLYGTTRAEVHNQSSCFLAAIRRSFCFHCFGCQTILVSTTQSSG